MSAQFDLAVFEEAMENIVELIKNSINKVKLPFININLRMTFLKLNNTKSQN